MMRTFIGVIPVTMVVTSMLSMSRLEASNDEGTKVIKVTAKRFEYTPQQITLKKGVPAIFQLTSEDRTHGFNIPAMNLRADIAPGKITELKVIPQKTGEFDFFCDVFCGSGHEGMNGKITVTE
jgi:cytochrome c oxidase subunit II